MTKCYYCGEPVNPGDPETRQRVVGWGYQRAHGSRRAVTSNIVLAETRQEFAHGDCIRRIQRGVAPTQGGLL